MKKRRHDWELWEFWEFFVWISQVKVWAFWTLVLNFSFPILVYLGDHWWVHYWFFENSSDILKSGEFGIPKSWNLAIPILSWPQHPDLWLTKVLCLFRICLWPNLILKDAKLVLGLIKKWLEHEKFRITQWYLKMGHFWSKTWV